MRCLTPDQARTLDRRTFEGAENWSQDFIEKAGQGIFKLLKKLNLDSKSTLVLVGPGNNGADGKVVARLLVPFSSKVDIWSPSAELTLLKQAPANFADYEVVIDALFGVGLNRPITGVAALVIERLNSERKSRFKSAKPLRVIAVDVPSGLNALTGWSNGSAVKADWTVTFQAAKPGFFQNEGPGHVGRLLCHRLPYPQDLFLEIASTHFACGINTASALIPRRKAFANKANFGVVNLIAGSAKYPGAGVLCARASLRAGVGYVRLIQFEDVYPEWFEIPESLFEKWSEIPNTLDAKATWVVGPGLDSEDLARNVIQKLLECECDKVILDATALSAIAGMQIKLPDSWIVTPHPKELSRILEMKVEDIQANRFAAAERAFASLGATVILKGYKTIVHHRGRHYISLRGNVALAKAGSGDVLAGILGALRAQGLSALEASVLGVLLHGITADLWLKNGDSASLNPSDIIELLPAAQKMVKTFNHGNAQRVSRVRIKGERSRSGRRPDHRR